MEWVWDRADQEDLVLVDTVLVDRADLVLGDIGLGG